MVVSYTNNYGHIDPYSQQRQINNMATNADGGGNGGGGAFFKMFEEKEAEEKRDTSISSNPLDDLYNMNQNYYASQNVIKDYIDNSLLLNTEQVACTNIAQHLALKGNVKDTLNFLNVQAAKSMVNSKKRKYNFSAGADEKNLGNKISINPSQKEVSNPNFFETGVGMNKSGNTDLKLDNTVVSNPSVNFFMR